MVLELLSDTNTDIISALEQKCYDNKVYGTFEDDLRVHNAIRALESKEYDMGKGIESIYDQLSFMDSYWVLSYLLKETEETQSAKEIDSTILKHFNPFKSFNPITRGLACCRAIEKSNTQKDLDCAITSLDKYVGKYEDDTSLRMYDILSRIAEKRREYVKQHEHEYIAIIQQVNELIRSGDIYMNSGNYIGAEERYFAARNIVQKEICDDNLYDWINLKIDSLIEKTLDECFPTDD